MTKIDIVSGFLGAGKTTLIKKLIEEVFVGEKLVLIENEFGEIGIDGGFLKDAGIQITEMNSGCICCSLVGDFGTALQEVISKFSPDRILIEPSGVGKLSDVIKAVEDVKKENQDILLNSYITVADVTKCKMYMKNFGEFFNNQIEHANTIVLSRTQKVATDKLETVVDLIRDKNQKATIITTPWEQLEGKRILEAMEQKSSLEEELLKEQQDHSHHSHKHKHEEDCGCGHHHSHEHKHEEDCECGHHHADEIFTSWGIETPRKFTNEEVQHALEQLSETDEYGVILRAKGILPSIEEEWIYFDFVPEEYEIRTGVPDYTGRICVIGTKLDTDKLENMFHVTH